MLLSKKVQILVIGHNDNGCTLDHEKIAYEIGYELAKSGCVLLNGGLGGVMKRSEERRVGKECRL